MYETLKSNSYGGIAPHPYPLASQALAPTPPPYCPPYLPYNLLLQILIAFCRENYSCCVRIGTKEVRVSVDRIKPAYIISDDTPSSMALVPKTDPQRPSVTTRFGRHV
ncbi:hypothetical protein HNY73_013134 [Argiope bruennichi]|uniref:Uncharacterized protein n=1 Tax=Argiope bruennichi TaxID=94029 RepID=A0A8T0EYQ7_ARGBR|nr:hypothetical protein HNY73_013134 [Argiope bruennichi]